jgi:hypothetical protein
MSSTWGTTCSPGASFPPIAAPAAVHPNAALLAAALAAAAPRGPIAIDTTQLEQTLTAAYDQLAVLLGAWNSALHLVMER